MGRVFAYSVNSRVIWLSDNVFHIPVLDDLYRIHLVENCQNIESADCVNYTVKFFHKFLQENLVSSPLKEEAKANVLLLHEKVKCFVRLSDFIRYSLDSSMPMVFKDEAEKIEVLSKSIIDSSNLSAEEQAKHTNFIASLIDEKKQELKKRYIKNVHLIKNARDLKEIKEIEYSLIFEGIHIV